MGAGLAFGGAALGQALQGYNQGKEQSRQIRFQQASSLADQADRVSKTIATLSPSDPSRQPLFDKYSDLMDQHDKLIGEKGQGAWKGIKSIFGLGAQPNQAPDAKVPASPVAPAQSQPIGPPPSQAASPDSGGLNWNPPSASTSPNTEGQTQPIGPAPIAAPAPAAQGQTSSVIPPRVPGVSPIAAAPTASSYRIQAYNPATDPNVKTSNAAQLQTITQATDQMKQALINPQTGQPFANMNDLKANPQAYGKIMDAIASSVKGEAQGIPGLTAALTGVLNTMTTPHESMIDMTSDHPFASILGIQPGQHLQVSPQTFAEIAARNTPPIQMQNEHARLGTQIAQLQASGQPVPKDVQTKFDSLDSIIRPERTPFSAYLQGVNRSDPAAVQKAVHDYMSLDYKLRQEFQTDSEKYNMATGADGYLYRIPTKAGGTASKILDENKNPIYVGEKGRNGSEWVVSKGPDQQDISRPNTHVIARNLANGTKSIEEAQDELDRMPQDVPNPAKMGANAGLLSQNLPDTIKNPDYLALKAVVDQAKNKAAGPNNPPSVLGGGGGSIPTDPYAKPGQPPIPQPRPQ